MDPIIIVTGWRYWPYPVAVWKQLDARFRMLGPFTLFHGACEDRSTGELIGADRHADDWGNAQRGVLVERRPADWDRFKRSAGPIRNQGMVDEALTLAPPENIHGLAFPGPGSRGTINCIKCMDDAGIAVDTWDIPRTRKWLKDVGHP